MPPASAGGILLFGITVRTMTKRKIHWIIPIANELGYFPNAAQATRINCRSYELYMELYADRIPPKVISKEDSDKTIPRAIDEIMTEDARRLKRKMAF